MNQYMQFCSTAFGHALAASARRRRSYLVAGGVLLMAMIPALLLILPHNHTEDIQAHEVFTHMVEMLFILTVTPLLALFYGAMLLGEDIESQTIAYIVARPIPRSAWIIGRFAAYLAWTSLVLFGALVATFLASATLDASLLTAGNLGLLFQYQLVASAALMGYGAICMLLGAVVRRPVIVGVLLFFGWQRAAMMAPGVTDFFTIEKHVYMLLPDGGYSVLSQARVAVFDAYKSEYGESAAVAALTLLAVAIVCVGLTAAAVRQREYTTPTAVTE